MYRGHTWQGLLLEINEPSVAKKLQPIKDKEKIQTPPFKFGSGWILCIYGQARTACTDRGSEKIEFLNVCDIVTLWGGGMSDSMVQEPFGKQHFSLI